MFTVIETLAFQKQAAKIWSDVEHGAFIDWIATSPLAGDVIQGTNGARKVRWGAQGKGKRGGVRVIYFNMINDEILLISVYAKSDKENILKSEIERSRK